MLTTAGVAFSSIGAREGTSSLLLKKGSAAVAGKLIDKVLAMRAGTNQE
jgi:hypothetical protein